MDGGWAHLRPAMLYLVAGTLLTLVTIVLCLLNAISAQQAIALAMLATLATVGGLIGMIVPDAWVAWRRGFQRGCEVATSCQPHSQPGKIAADPTPPGPGDQADSDLLARC